MTAKQKIDLRLSEIRKKLAELAGNETLTDEQRAEIGTLRTEFTDLETRSQALIVADSGEGETEEVTEGDAEEREYAALLENASLGEVFAAALSHRAAEGETAELQQHLKMDSNCVPLDMLSTREDRARLEQRTTGVTPAPADAGAMQRPIIPYVFPQSAVAFLDIQQDRVGVGEAVYTVLSTAAAPGTPAEGTEQAHSTGAFEAKVLSPGRIQASLFYTREDRARLAGMDAALRQNLSDALADALDEAVLDDLLTGSTLGNNNASAADDYATYRKRFLYDQIDGIYASMAGDVKMVLGSDSYGDMAATYRSNNSDMNALGAIMTESAGVRVSAHAPTTASNKQNGLIRLGSRQDYACGLWESITIIPDEISKAASGELILTAVLLYAKALLRSGGFAKVQAQHS